MDQPRNDSPRTGTPNYEQPRSAPSRDTSGRDAPAREPRYLPPDNSGSRGGLGNDSSRTPEPARGSNSGSSLDNGRVWRPEGGGALEFERRQPRTPVPTLTGTPRLLRDTPGEPRPGLSSRAGRAPVLDGTARSRTSEGEGLVRLPRTEITRESILNRYRGSPAADAIPARTRAGTDNDLSRARGGTRAIEPTARFDDRARAARERASTSAPRGSVEAARRERESIDRIENLRRERPGDAIQVENAGRVLARVADTSAQISIGVGVGFATGVYAGWFWEPTCSPHWAAPYSHWNATFGWGSPYWNYWAYGPCSYGWPFSWGFSWYHHGWSLGWNSYGYSPYSGYCYPYSYRPYSYAYWSPAPVYYTTVVNDYGRDYGGSAVVYEEPRAEGEAVVVADDVERGRVVQGKESSAAPDVKADMVRGAAEYLALGDDAFREGRYSDAVHHYARAVEYAPNDGVLYLILSDALFATGDYHYAAFALRRAIELEPKVVDKVIDKHNFYGNPSDFDKQIALAEQYLNEHFLDEDARLVLAANYLFARRPAQCADLLQSPFSQSVREATPGRLILERAEAERKAASLSDR
ncbi:MAG: tetratricopeptide repeat protein [Planctomycetes bacterium]|nr:tetratricopeptide repeat protein [Planctomycetota bacterium]